MGGDKLKHNGWAQAVWCSSDTNPRVELTHENWFIRGGCLGANNHMFKPIINQCGTFGIVTNHHAPQPTSTAALTLRQGLRPSPGSPFRDDDHRAATHIGSSPYSTWWVALIPNDMNPQVELTPENRFTRGGSLGANKYMFKPILNQCGTFGIVTQS